MIKQIQKITTKAIIIKASKVLCLKDTKGTWELPGGRIEFGESPEEALKREIREELGFSNVKILKPVSIWSFVIASSISKQYIVLIYECEILDLQNRIPKNNEFLEYAWCHLSEIKKLKMKTGYKKAIEKYFSKHNGRKIMAQRPH